MNRHSDAINSRKPDLNEIVTGLLHAVSPEAISNKNIFINEIPSKLSLITDQHLVTTVLDGLLSSVVKHTRQSCIRLSAKMYGHVVLIHVKKQGIVNNTLIREDADKLHILAEKILGSVSLNAERKDISTLTFGFPNLPPLD